MQIGADLAGVDAALKMDYATTGWMPKKFRNKTGLHPEFVEKYGAKESSDYGYRTRTYLNIKDSDATLIFAGNPNSAGTKCTLAGISKFNRPFLLINPIAEKVSYPKNMLEWLNLNNVKTLNIAGNSEDNFNGIYDFTFNFVCEILRLNNEGKYI